MLEFVFFISSEHVAVIVNEFHHRGLRKCGVNKKHEQGWKDKPTLYEGDRRNETIVSSNQEDGTALAILERNEMFSTTFWSM